MSVGDRPEVVTVELSEQEIFVTRGAMNATLDLVEAAPSQLSGFGVKIEAEPQHFRMASRELADALEHRVPGFPTDVGLSPAEQQAIQDAVVSVDKLLSSPRGQTLLSNVGVMPEPDDQEKLRDVLVKILDARSGQ